MYFSWTYLTSHVQEIDREARELNKKTRSDRYHVHIGHGIYVSVSDGYMCLDLRQFYVPYGLHANSMRPTKCGIALRLKEWGSLLDQLLIIEVINSELAETKPCCQNSDHINLLAVLCCHSCNPFQSTTWN